MSGSRTLAQVADGKGDTTTNAAAEGDLFDNVADGKGDTTTPTAAAEGDLFDNVTDGKGDTTTAAAAVEGGPFDNVSARVVYLRKYFIPLVLCMHYITMELPVVLFLF